MTPLDGNVMRTVETYDPEKRFLVQMNLSALAVIQENFQFQVMVMLVKEEDWRAIPPKVKRLRSVLPIKACNHNGRLFLWPRPPCKIKLALYCGPQPRWTDTCFI